jgi:glucoamylase
MEGHAAPEARPADLARAGREDARPDPSELASALLGAGGLLVPLDASGEPQQLFWPHPDRDPNLASFALGVLPAVERTSGARGITWLRELPAVQRIEDDADVVTTTLAVDGTVDAVRLDAVIDPGATAGTAVLMLDVAFAGATGPHHVVVDLTLLLGGTPRSNATFVDPSGALVAHRHDRVLALAAGSERAIIACDIEPAGPQGSTRDVRIVVPARTATTLVLALAHDPTSAVDAARATLARGAEEVRAARRAADCAASAARTPTLVDAEHDVLDRVGLRVLRALQDPSGGVLAAPECDPDMRRSGGYGFVWARDLAFIITAAAVAGARDVVDGALDWLVAAQSPDGLYEQRHWSDGRVAPTWGLQLDETGAVLHAIGEAARVLEDATIVARCWPTVRAGADALADLLDVETGLPPASLDAWEERVGVHTYTVAATIAGLEASARMADGRDDDAAARWTGAAARCRAALDAHLWSEGHGRFLRSVAVARDDADGAPVPPRHQPPGRPAHPVRSVDPIDATIDASLLGLAYPFGVLAHDDPRLVATIDAIEQALRAGPGLLRYPGDSYVGGNPWLLTRLWLGLARRAPGSRMPADGIAEVAGTATDGLLLAEQVDERTGRPVWVVPLAWSHAFYALACRPDHRPAAGP